MEQRISIFHEPIYAPLYVKVHFVKVGHVGTLWPLNLEVSRILQGANPLNVGKNPVPFFLRQKRLLLEMISKESAYTYKGHSISGQ